MYRALADFWNFSRRYRLYGRISSLSHDLLCRDHEFSDKGREALERLNRQRIACQQKIGGLDLPSFARCCDCGGVCCREPSEHYFTAIDYWLRRDTVHEVQRYAGHGALPLHRYLAGRLGTAWRRLASAAPAERPPVREEGARCTHLGEQGCRLPHAERPLKCLIYACQGLKRSLDEPTRRLYIDAIKELERISMRTFNVLKRESGVPFHYGIVSLLLTL